MKKIQYTPKAMKKLVQLKQDIEKSYGDTKAKQIIKKILIAIDDLQVFENKGISVEQCLKIPCEYRMLFVQHNYIFYRSDEEHIAIVDIYNEKEDFMWKLFGIRTTTQDTLDYWQE